MVLFAQKPVETPQVQFWIRLLGYPFVERRQVPMVLSAQKTVEVPRLQFIDMPVVVQQQVPMVVTVQKPVLIPQVRFLGKVVDVLVVVSTTELMVQTVQRTVWDPLSHSITN